MAHVETSGLGKNPANWAWDLLIFMIHLIDMGIARGLPRISSILAIAFLMQLTCFGEIIPANRRMNWVPGQTVGVPGGIPNRSTIFVNVLTTNNSAYKCAGDGVTDDTAKLQAAMVDCPAGQVVYVPAATYLIKGAVTVGAYDPNFQNFTLRGAGMGQTIFKLANSTGRFNIGTTENQLPTTGALPVTAGARSGSSVLTVADTTTVHPGNLVTMLMSTPTWMHCLGPLSQGNVFRMTFKVVSKTATTVTITPPIPTPFDLTPYNPTIIPWGNSGGYGHVTNGIGFEGFTIDATNGSSVPMTLQQAWGCWFKEVEVFGTTSRQLFLMTVCASEVRRCYTHDTSGTGPNHEGIDFKNDGCWNLIEDNISVNGGYPEVVLGDAQGGCVGNVIGYNYLERNISDLGAMEYCLSDNHGTGGNMLNLIEGNIVRGYCSDGYFGGSSYGTLFRNSISNKALPQDNGAHNANAIAINLCHYAVYYNVVGNVLGDPSMTSYYDTEAAGSTVLIWRLGYPNVGGYDYSRNYIPPSTTIASYVNSTTVTMSVNAGADAVALDPVAIYRPTPLVIHDLHLTAGSATVTSSTAAVTPADVGRAIAYTGEGAPNSSYANAWTIGPTTPPDYTNSPIGNPAVAATALDLNVKNTIIRHGNYDYATKAMLNYDGSGGAAKSPGIVWETDDSRGTGVGFDDHNIPNSYYLSGKPSWWPAAIPWPAIGPDLKPIVSQIPAQVRFASSTKSPPARPLNLRVKH